MGVEVPDGLVDEIRGGNCVAFIGAGFSAAAGMPGWRHLLAWMAETGTPGRSPAIEALDAVLKDPQAATRHLEMAAQVLHDELGDVTYRQRLQAALGRLDHLPRQMKHRLDRITGIPFRAVVTTNFDPLLQGETPGSEAYRQLLRPRAHRWWDQRFWPRPGTGRAPGPMVVKIHGDVSSDAFRDVVFTRREYRSRLHADAAYLGTLRSLFATTTVLYLGYSLSDEYLNQVRGELLEAMGSSDRVPTLAYALLPDPTPLERTYYARHEGIELIPYAVRDEEDHGQFDDFLDHLYEQTNPIHILGSRLQNRRILWMDPNEEWSEDGMRFLTSAVQRASDLSADVDAHHLFVTTDTVDEAEAALDEAGDGGFDLIITRWGHELGHSLSGAPCSEAQALLERLARRRAAGRAAPPVIVFASGAYADDNKPVSLRAGAIAYTSTWETLFQTIDAVFAPGSGTL